MTLISHSLLQLILSENQLQMQTNRLYEQVRIDLWNIRKLGVRRVEQALLSLIPARIPQQVVPMIRECLKASKRDVELIQYLQVIDLILNHPIYNQILHSCLLELYPTILSSLLKAGHRKEVEEAKVIRKYWVRRIHPDLYIDLREVTLRIVGIDIDFFEIKYNTDALLHVRHYYTNVLNMPPKEVEYYLPQVAFICLQSQPQQSEQYSKTQGIPKSGFSSLNLQMVGPAERLKDRKQASSDIISNNLLSKQKACLPQYTIGKRIRYSSEETNAGDLREQYETLRKIPPKTIGVSSIYFDNSDQPQNEKHRQPISTEVKQYQSLYQEAATEAKILRENMKSLYTFECYECGARFQIKKNLDQHREKHIKEKLCQHEEKEIKQKGPSKQGKHRYYQTQASWVMKNDRDTQTQQQWTAISDKDKVETQPTYTCLFCGEDLEQRFLDDQWKIYNAVRALFNEESNSFHSNNQQQVQYYLHSACAKSLVHAKNNPCDWQVRLS